MIETYSNQELNTLAEQQMSELSSVAHGDVAGHLRIRERYSMLNGITEQAFRDTGHTALKLAENQVDTVAMQEPRRIHDTDHMTSLNLLDPLHCCDSCERQKQISVATNLDFPENISAFNSDSSPAPLTERVESTKKLSEVLSFPEATKVAEPKKIGIFDDLEEAPFRPPADVPTPVYLTPDYEIIYSPKLRHRARRVLKRTKRMARRLFGKTPNFSF